MLNGIDKGGAFLAKLFAKLCTYGVAYAVIYIAVQTALPGLRSAFIYNVAMIIVMAAPELMIAGLAVEAMDKLKENKALGLFLFVVAALFLSIGILTMIDVFFWKFADGSTGQQMLTLYRAIVVLIYSAVHGIVAKMNEQRGEKVQQVAQANDRLVIANQKDIETLDTQVNALTQQVNGLVNAVNALTVQVNAVNVSASQVTSSVDLEQFHALSQTVYEMKTSVNQVNQNFLNITQNLYNTPGQRVENAPFSTRVDEVYADHAPLQGIAEGRSDDYDTERFTSLPVPVLDVPGVPQERVQAALIAHLTEGTAWGRLPGKYATNKLIKEAYEIYLSTHGQRVNA